jgi:glycosyltransferase involved in cell wall biosynthesis
LLPICRHIHVVDGFGLEEREIQVRRRVLIRRWALARSLVVLPSRNLVRIAADIWKLSPSRIRYVPNGVDLARFSPGSAHSAGEPTIGTVAALRNEKNLPRLLRAFRLATAEQPGRLTIVGDGAERPMLESLASELGIAERVLFTGQRDDTPALYRGFDIFALSSDTEQMPLSVIEAMASGLPISTTDVGDVRTMVAEENAPFVVHRDDVALAGSLSALLRDRDLRARIGSANLAKARRDFDQAGMFSAWGALWSGTTEPA